MSTIFTDEKLSFPSKSRFIPRPPAEPPAKNSSELIWDKVVFYGSLTALTVIMGYLAWRNVAR